VSRSAKPLVVEFFGTPGAGKTTLLKAARTIFQARGFQACSVVEAARPYAQRTFLGKAVNSLSPAGYRKQLLWQVFYYTSFVHRLKFIRKHQQLARYVTHSQKHRPDEAAIRERRVLYWFHHLMGYYEFLTTHGRPGEVLIWDDGFVHRAVHLHASTVETPNLEDVRTYVGLIPQPDIVIVPCTPLEICEERIMQRGIWKHFQNKSRAELKQYLVSSQQVVNGTVDYIKAKGWTVIEVDNSSNNPALTHEELQKKLMNTAPFIENNWKA
jgi:thymidylate kinase